MVSDFDFDPNAGALLDPLTFHAKIEKRGHMGADVNPRTRFVPGCLKTVQVTRNCPARDSADWDIAPDCRKLFGSLANLLDGKGRKLATLEVNFSRCKIVAEAIAYHTAFLLMMLI
ncbi:MAG: hypothetical protein QM796_20655 [Chthoniobacteraceae bacterium]